MTIEFLYFESCAKAPAVRALLSRCLDRLSITERVNARQWDGPSPTIRINGVDVMTESPTTTLHACRLDVPTEAGLLGALERARSSGL